MSDTTANSFRLSWTSDEDMFDRFVIKIRDSRRVGHPREYSVGGAERTKVITGLMSGTEYEIELYGVTLDERSQPITGVAQTGICKMKTTTEVLLVLTTTELLSFRSCVHCTHTNHLHCSGLGSDSWKFLALFSGVHLCFCY